MKMKNFSHNIGWVSLVAVFFAVIGWGQVFALDYKSLAGTYRCWSFNVGGGGGACTNPPLVLNQDGTYALSTEKGKVTIKDQSILLSQSKFRGAGILTDDGMQIQFKYKYKGLEQTVTYLRTSTAEKSGKLVFLGLTVRYLKEQGWLDSVSTVELEAIGGSDKTVYTALAWGQDGRNVKGNFKTGVPGGIEYSVFLSTGTDRVLVGKIDLKNKSGEPQVTLRVQEEPKQEKAAPASDSKTKEREIPSIPTDKPKADTAKPKVLPRCNPDVPHYAQPECID